MSAAPGSETPAAGAPEASTHTATPPATATPLHRFAAVRLVWSRELRALFESAVAPVFLIAGLVLLNALYMNEFFLAGRLDMTPLFRALAPLAVVLLPAVTMRSWAEERRQRTLELWMTLPLTPWQVVLGKYLGALSLTAIFLAGTLPVAFMLVSLGDPDLGRIASGYIGALCLASSFLAAGLFLSSISRDQITAYLLAVLALALTLALGHPRVVAVLDGTAPDLGAGRFLSRHVSSLPHFEAFLRGRIELGALVHFAGWTAVLLFANASAVKRLRP